MDNKIIINQYGKKVSKMNSKTLFYKVVEFSSTFIGKAIVTGISLFVAYQFYQLGYAFLYGYYFGGSEDNIVPLTIMINQVPFDIKYITALGFFVFAIILLIVMLSYMYIIKEGNLLQKIIILLLTAVTFILLNSLLSLTFNNLSHIDTNFELYKNMFYLFFFIYSVLSCLSHLFSLNDNSTIRCVILFFVNILIIILNVIIVNQLKVYNLFFWSSIIVGSYIFNSITMLMVNKIINILKHMFNIIKRMYLKLIWPINIFIIITFTSSSMIFVKHFWIIIISGGFLVLSNIIVWFIRKRRTINTKNVLNNTYRLDNRRAKFWKNISALYISVLIICFLIGYMLLYSVFYNLGNQMGRVSSNLVYSKIDISNQKFSCLGMVVKQRNNTYYISDSNRKLVIITSNQVLITMQHLDDNP